MSLQDIEKLYRENTEQSHTPPQGAWQSIETRMQTPGSNKHTGTGSPWWLAAAMAVLAAAAAIPLLLPKSDPLAELIYPDQPSAELPATASDTPSIATAHQAQNTTTTQPAAPDNSTVADLQTDGSEYKDIIEPAADNSILADLQADENKPADLQTATLPATTEKPSTDGRSTETKTTNPSTNKGSFSTQSEKTVPKTAYSTQSEKTVPKTAYSTQSEKTVNPGDKANEQANTPRLTPQTAPLLQDDPLFVPNLITPNGDGYNDIWRIDGIESLGRAHVAIYTPQGQLVYKNNDYRNDFDGAGLKDGDYIFVLQIKERGITRRGALHIKRK